MVKFTDTWADNQWQVDFNISLMSFEPHVAGVSNLIKLSSASLNSAPIFFTSSIGTVGNWNVNHPNELVPETAIDDLGVAEYQGYSESKWIAEKLLDAAAEKCGVSAAICRVGQIAGPVERGLKGVWNVQEWLPSVRNDSCQKFGCDELKSLLTAGTDNCQLKISRRTPWFPRFNE